MPSKIKRGLSYHLVLLGLVVKFVAAYYQVKLEILYVDQIIAGVPHTFKAVMETNQTLDFSGIWFYEYIWLTDGLLDVPELIKSNEPVSEVNIVFPEMGIYYLNVKASYVYGEVEKLPGALSAISFGSFNRTFDIGSQMKGGIVIKQDNISYNEYIGKDRDTVLTLDLHIIKQKFFQNCTTDLRVWWFDNCDFVGNSKSPSINEVIFDDLNELHTLQAIMLWPELGETLADIDFHCKNQSLTITERNKPIRGLFKSNFVTLAVVDKLKVHGDMRLETAGVAEYTTTYVGSPPFQYCVKKFPLKYKLTERENCTLFNNTEALKFVFRDRIEESKVLLFIVRNRASWARKAVTVDVFKDSDIDDDSDESE